MRYAICDIKPASTDGTTRYITATEINLAFFQDDDHEFTYRIIEGKDVRVPLGVYWEYTIESEDVKILVFPTLSEMNYRPGDWIGEIMESLNISNDDLSNICFILHDKDFGDMWDTAFDDEQSPQYVYYQDNGYVISNNLNDDNAGNGKLFLFQHDADDSFFREIALGNSPWEERWRNIKTLIQWE